MFRKLFFYFLVFAGMLVSRVSVADENHSRAVIGGDLVFTANATGATEEEALFKAEAQAVRMITIECSVPHRETKIFNQTLTVLQGRFKAEVSAGLPLNSCEEAQNASPETKKLLTSETLLSEQETYERILYGEKKFGPAPAKYTTTSAPLFQQLRQADYRFHPQFMASYQHYLTAQTDCREEVRTLIRQGNTAQADALTLQCR
jgi:hypothetical protein